MRLKTRIAFPIKSGMLVIMRVLIVFLVFLTIPFSVVIGESKKHADTKIPPSATPTAVPPRPIQELFASCVRCHTIGKGTLIGPDLLGVQDRHDDAWLIKFIQSSNTLRQGGDKHAQAIFEANKKLPMPDHVYTEAEARAIIDYIIAEGNLIKANPKFLDNTINFAPPSNNWIFILAVLILFLALLDLFFINLSKYKFVNIALILLALAMIGKIVRDELLIMGRSLGYEPEQPIKFSHKVHSGENKIQCIYCHTGVYESKYASIPPVSICLNCHNVITRGTNTAEMEIDKIHESVNSGKPVRWVKVYNLPKHVFFSHAQHVKVGKIECKTCHGDVASMGRIQQVVDLSMGWCVNCHRETKVDFDNKYYTSYKLHEDLKSGKISKVTAQDIGANNCQKCHY